ncbi:MAG: hypothetical protein Q7T53_11625 [Deltaproteobacteria bacterium]|nr:hypothetical protein [Deltaproteobacteria bacterium]
MTVFAKQAHKRGENGRIPFPKAAGIGFEIKPDTVKALDTDDSLSHSISEPKRVASFILTREGKAATSRHFGNSVLNSPLS